MILELQINAADMNEALLINMLAMIASDSTNIGRNTDRNLIEILNGISIDAFQLLGLSEYSDLIKKKLLNCLIESTAIPELDFDIMSDYESPDTAVVDNSPSESYTCVELEEPVSSYVEEDYIVDTKLCSIVQCRAPLHDYRLAKKQVASYPMKIIKKEVLESLYNLNVPKLFVMCVQKIKSMSEIIRSGGNLTNNTEVYHMLYKGQIQYRFIDDIYLDKIYDVLSYHINIVNMGKKCECINACSLLVISNLLPVKIAESICEHHGWDNIKVNKQKIEYVKQILLKPLKKAMVLSDTYPSDATSQFMASNDVYFDAYALNTQEAIKYTQKHDIPLDIDQYKEKRNNKIKSINWSRLMSNYKWLYAF
jgi:hypothetical protein